MCLYDFKAVVFCYPCSPYMHQPGFAFMDAEQTLVLLLLGEKFCCAIGLTRQACKFGKTHQLLQGVVSRFYFRWRKL